MPPAERHAYDEHLSAMMIQNDVLDGAKLEGRQEGRQEGLVEGFEKGRMEVARNMKKLKVSTDIIVQSTGLSKEEIERL